MSARRSQKGPQLAAEHRIERFHLHEGEQPGRCPELDRTAESQFSLQARIADRDLTEAAPARGLTRYPALNCVVREGG